MEKEEILKLINSNPAFFLATEEDGQPHVRGMLLYKADNNGIMFHTGSWKEVYKQVIKNPKAELCFNAKGTQIRVTGELEVIDDLNIKEEIVNHPSRGFLKTWKEAGLMKDFYESLIVLNLKNPVATTWTMEQNFDEKTYIKLN